MLQRGRKYSPVLQVLEELPADLLNEFFVFCTHCWGVDSCLRVLFPCSILDWSVRVRRILPFGRLDVVELLQRPPNISRHGKVDLSSLIIPIERDSDILVALPVGRDLILFLVCEDTHEMMDMLFSHVFDAEVIDYQRE